MKKIFLRIGISGLIIFCSTAHGIAQAYKHPDEEVTEDGIFPSHSNTANKKSPTRRSSGGGTFDDNPTFEGNIPIDGGLSVVVTALFGYGIKSLRKRRQLKKDV